MKYRKKPEIVDAFQYDGDLIDSEGRYYVPEWAAIAHQTGVLFYMQGDSSPMELYLNTYGEHWNVCVGDYLICHEDGSLAVCGAQAFERDYEPVGSADRTDKDHADRDAEDRNYDKMRNYIGVKIVKAGPEEKGGRSGYRVKYPDGYVSWSSKDVFEEAYRELGCEDFINSEK